MPGVVVPPGASDALRSALIFLPDDGRLVRFDGGFELRTPSNPAYWWGNTLFFDDAPIDGDFARWTALFRTRIHAVQPASTHTTFGWDGDVSGAVEPFVAAGFEHFTTLGLGCDRGTAVEAPHAGAETVAPLDGADWTSLLRLLVDTRLVAQAEADYADYATRQIARWRTLQETGQGSWFGVRGSDGLVAALGVFAERRRGPDGRRIGRFQNVVTHPSARRRGFAGRLVAHASRYALERLDVDALLIMADEHGDARRVYEACGYRFRSRHHGLELPS